jgi:hypothetical protein
MKLPQLNILSKTLVVLFVLLFISSTLPSSLSSETYDSTTEIIHTIYSGTYSIISDETEDVLSIPNFGYLQIPGTPKLPSKIFSIALPPSATLKTITFEYPETIELPGTYNILPSPLPRVIGDENPAIYQQELTTYNTNYDDVYQSNNPYPKDSTEFLRTSGYREYNLIDIRFTPFTYYPQVQTLTYHPEVTITIDFTIDTPNIIPIDIGRNQFSQELAQKIISNYDQTTAWYQPIQPRTGYDYVIITTDTLETHIDSLVQWEENKGRNVNVVTTSWLNNQYDGYDLQEKMRNFLREKYPTDQWGITDVCLIGDYDDVPMRRTAQNTGYGAPETDFYYAELSLPDDQSWDADGDHNYGENSDPIDFYSEVNVGRIPWSDPQTVEHICEKSVAYEQTNDPSYKKNILLLGAYFWADTDNAVLMETKVDQTWMADWTMTRMYEQGHSTYSSDYDLNYQNVKNIWSSDSFAFVNWAGHGSPTSCHIMYSKGSAFVDSDTCIYLNDDYPAIIFADACSNSDTDNLNIGQAMLKQGGVGFLGATKVAYGMPGWSHAYGGSSQSLDYFFTVCCTSGTYTQGQAHQWGLVEMYTNGLWYYDKYETFEWGALWGNPDLQMGLINKAPDMPTKPSGPTTGVNNVDYTFSTMSQDPDQEDLYYQFNWGDGTVSDWYGPYASGQTIEATYAWPEAGIYDITVRAKDVVGGQSLWSEPLTITIVEGPILDIGGISGGFFRVNSVVWNRGAAEATGVSYRITLDGGTILLGRETTGVIQSIAGGAFEEITSGPIFGFGKTRVIVEAELPMCSDVQDQGATVFLFLIKVNPGGG